MKNGKKNNPSLKYFLIILGIIFLISIVCACGLGIISLFKQELNCSDGTSGCGCPDNYLAEGETCISKYETNPKYIILNYTLRGDKNSFEWKVYGGLNDYLATRDKGISYNSEKEPEPTVKDFILKNIDDETQKIYLDSFVDKIKNLSNNSDEQVRVAISIIQNIPYDDNYSRKLERYAYQVLYDNSGNFGEKSELLAYILRKLGDGTALIIYGDIYPINWIFGDRFFYQAVGIKCPLEYSYDNTGYCFIESSTPWIVTDSSKELYDENCMQQKGSILSMCLQKLPSNYTLFIISDGMSFNSSEEYKDAQEFERIYQYSYYADYYMLEKLTKKYGIPLSTS